MASFQDTVQDIVVMTWSYFQTKNEYHITRRTSNELLGSKQTSNANSNTKAKSALAIR
jgi:hypothetical protein